MKQFVISAVAVAPLATSSIALARSPPSMAEFPIRVAAQNVAEQQMPMPTIFRKLLKQRMEENASGNRSRRAFNASCCLLLPLRTERPSGTRASM